MRGVDKMTMKQFIIRIVCILALTVAGCGAYYKISDPGTGKTYYSDKINKKNGSIEFKDAHTRSTVTLQNSEIIEVSKEEYKANTPKY